MTPTTSVAAKEQLRVVGVAVRREMLVLGAMAVAWLVGIPVAHAAAGEPLPAYFDPAEMGYLGVLLGLAAPLAVWKGESPFGESTLWSLPVNHARHARMKVAAGWVWLMALVAFAVVALWLFLELTGISTTRSRLLTTLPAGPVESREAFTSVPWSTPAWQWMSLFTGATAAYLAASALVLGVRRPLYWAAGIWLALLGFAELEVYGFAWFNAVVDMFDLGASGGIQVNREYYRLPSGEAFVAWTRFPTPGPWAAATAGWLALTVAAVWAASRRHREG
jgi:hypothetical protein